MLRPSLSLVLCLAMALLVGGCLSVDQRVIDGRDLGSAASFYPGLHYLYGDTWFDEAHGLEPGRQDLAKSTDAAGLAGRLWYGASLLILTFPEAALDTILLPCDVLLWLCCAED